MILRRSLHHRRLVCGGYCTCLLLCYTVLYSNTVYVVPRCGKLFEWYMEVCAPYTQHRRWIKELTAAEGEEGFPIRTDIENDIKTCNANGFVGWCLYHLSAIGSRCRRQMFYHTFVSTYFGLSRDGVDMLSRYGFTQALRTFDDTRDDIRLYNENKTR